MRRTLSRILIAWVMIVLYAGIVLYNSARDVAVWILRRAGP